MKERYGAIALPEIRPINLRELRKRKQMRGYFAPELVDEIERQIIL